MFLQMTGKYYVMRIKDTSVECKFHPILTAFLFYAEYEWLSRWGKELLITSGSEYDTYHSYKSMHYADPCCAADVRSWSFSFRGQEVNAQQQVEYLSRLAVQYCFRESIPIDWIEVILETDHIHIEYQPKRPVGMNNG